MTTKHDSGKLRWDLLPWRAVREVVGVLTFGAKKYAEWNWVTVPDARERYRAALDRHVAAWWCDGEALDPESGKHHLAHAACCVLFLLGLEVGDTYGREVPPGTPVPVSVVEPDPMPDFSDQISAKVSEVFAEVTSKREELLRAWVAETGVHPSDAEIVEVHDPVATRVFVRRREKSEHL